MSWTLTEAQTLWSIVQGISTLVIGILAYLIKKQQSETNKQTLRWHQYERKFRIFDSTMAIFNDVKRLNKIDIPRFRMSVNESKLICGKDLQAWMDFILKQALDYDFHHSEVEDSKITGQLNTPSHKERSELHGWFEDQKETVIQSFQRDMSIN